MAPRPAPRPADLRELATWLDDGTLRPAPTRTFPLADVRAALLGDLVGTIALQHV